MTKQAKKAKKFLHFRAAPICDSFTGMQPSFSRYLETCADVPSALNCVLNRSLDLAETRFGNVQLVDWKSGCLEIKAQRGFDTEFLNFFERVKLQDGTACARALRNRDAIIIEDVMFDPQFAPCREIISRAGFQAVQSTPLISSSGALVGILSTHFAMPHRPTDQQMSAIKDAAQLVANAIIRLRARTATQEILSSSRILLQQSRDVLMRAEAILSPASQSKIAQPLEGGLVRASPGSAAQREARPCCVSHSDHSAANGRMNAA